MVNDDFGITIRDMLGTLKQTKIYEAMLTNNNINKYFSSLFKPLGVSYIHDLAHTIMNDQQLQRLSNSFIYQCGADEFYIRWFDGVSITYTLYSEGKRISKEDAITIALTAGVYYHSFDKLNLKAFIAFDAMFNKLIPIGTSDFYVGILEGIHYELSNKEIYKDIRDKGIIQ